LNKRRPPLNAAALAATKKKINAAVIIQGNIVCKVITRGRTCMCSQLRLQLEVLDFISETLKFVT
jgi:hypothetical protein